MPVVNFTAEFLVTGLVCPEGKRKVQFCDADLPGLLLEQRASSAATWFVRYKVEGKTTYHRLGAFPDVSLEAARTAAHEFKASLVSGKPVDLTLDTFVQKHVNPYHAVHKRSHDRDLQLYQRIGPRFGHLKLADISRREAQTFHLELMDKEGLAPATADQHLAYLRHVLNLAVEWEYLQANQLAKVRLLKPDNQVQRFLSDEETRRLVQVLHADPASGQSAIFLFLLNTGARKGEALSALWEHVDLERRIWTIPAADSKSKKVRTVPLNDAACWVLERQPSRDVSPYVFLNVRTGKPFVSINRAWSRLSAQAGLEGVRIHDLRHSFASRLVNNGRSLYEVQRLLGHATPQMSMRYAHLASSRLQDAANTVSVGAI